MTMRNGYDILLCDGMRRGVIILIEVTMGGSDRWSGVIGGRWRALVRVNRQTE